MRYTGKSCTCNINNYAYTIIYINNIQIKKIDTLEPMTLNLKMASHPYIHPILKDMRAWIAAAAVASTIASAAASSPVLSSSCKVRNSR